MGPSTSLRMPPPRSGEDFITLSATVSKGTYIRSLARDIAHALGTVGHVSYLRRTRAGPFSLEQAISLDFLQTAAKARQLDGAVVPLIAALDDIPALPVTPDQAQLLRHGQKLVGFPAPPGLCLATLDGVSGRAGRSFGRRPPGRPGVQPLRRIGVQPMSITTERKEALIKEHGRGKSDTGSPEVQVAILTERIQQPDRAFQDPREGQSLAPRPADAGQPAPLAARLSARQGRASATPT